MNKTKISYGIYLFAPIFSPFRPFPEERGLSIIVGERKAWLKFRLIISNVRACLFLHLLHLSSGVAGRAMSAGSLPSGEGGGEAPSPRLYFYNAKILQDFLALGDNAKFCKVRRVSTLIMSEKKIFSFISGTRCRYQRNPLPIPTQHTTLASATPST